MELTYQQVLADVYEETAKNLLVYPNEHDGEDLPPEEKFDYEPNELPDPEEFNKFHGDRNKPEHVIKPDAKDSSKSSSKNPTQIKNFVLNIDGNFRSGIVPPPLQIDSCTGFVNDDFMLSGTDPAQFTFMLSKNWKNITSVKMTSMEFKNTFYTFSAARGNTSFNIQLTIGGIQQPLRTITIPDGNYIYFLNQTTGTPYLPLTPANTVLDTTTFVGAIQNQINIIGNELNTNQFQIEYNSYTHTIFFKMKDSINSWFNITFPTSITNANGNGIGYNLGFTKKSYISTLNNPPSQYATAGHPLNGIISQVVVADTAPDNIQDYYVYLQINDWNLVEHQESGQTHYNVFSKIQLNGPKNSVIYDNNYTNSSTKEYFFEQPTNIQRLDISMLDAFGNVLDLRGAAFSMTLELRQVNDSSVYEKLIEL